MELQAAVMGVRLKESIIKCHEVNYVANGVAEILEYSKLNDWRWCPGSLNPADEATRTKIPPTHNSKWISGPDFLHKDEEEWPDNSDMQSSEDHSNEEIRANYSAFATHRTETYDGVGVAICKKS
ncbi:PREDICTED: uncharacterized protein LOC108364056 [Rhagoletis zephyria]|uniref:uncharacterized protein LOC108364056 n=1 Tax=Rhagoletis zephyria TaxID=28612 RepID=UPI000811655D|nr:PREDICTED: uncharacterized protein LOC108364056 [Rhagoletis zephyria]